LRRSKGGEDTVGERERRQSLLASLRGRGRRPGSQPARQLPRAELSLAGAQPWERRRLAGVIKSIIVDPRPNERRVEVTLADATASIRVRFGAGGRPPLLLGAELLVDGVVRLDATDDLVVEPDRWVLLEERPSS
jgi:hypothetical protein